MDDVREPFPAKCRRIRTSDCEKFLLPEVIPWCWS
jgi:hypothetical protein